MSILPPPAAGTAHLTFLRTASETVLTRAFAKSPVKIFATRGRQPACWVYSATLGGGFVGGDEVVLTANVGENARALLTTQASTKVYRSLKPARQTITATVERGALLAVIPDPLVCFADANFTQTQRYNLRGDASLAVVDWMTSGRHAAGERWAFTRYESRLDIRRDDKPVLFDGIVLERGLDSVSERMGRFDILLTAVLTGPLVAERVVAICQSISQQPVVMRPDAIVTAARLNDGGLLMRMAGMRVEDIAHAIREHLRFLSPLLGDDLWRRKW